MLTYTRRQLLLLSLVVAGGAAGLAIDRWRRANADVVTYLETLDRAPTPSVREPSARRASVVPQANSLPARAVARPERARGRRADAGDATPVDVNLAGAAELERLPGVGPALAARIVEARTRDGPFGSVDDLRRVRGVRDATLERLRPRLAVNTP
jgi:competence protein ComEA